MWNMIVYRISLYFCVCSQDAAGVADGSQDEGAMLLQGAQTGALIAGAAVGLVFLGPLAPVAVLGGAGVYAM